MATSVLDPVSSDYSDFILSNQRPEPLSGIELNQPVTIAFIDPDPLTMRSAVDSVGKLNVASVLGFDYYPSIASQAAAIAKQRYDILLVNIDSNPREAFACIENIAVKSSAGIIAYGVDPSMEMLREAMRVGVREFLSFPLNPDEVARAIRRFVPEEKYAETGNLYVFLSAKGGSGVTTLAANFATALARNTGEKTALVDLDLPLGDAALALGVNSRYSSLDAINKGRDLDSSFMKTLFYEHQCGVAVLGAPGIHTKVNLHDGAANRLVSIARVDFKHTVLDAGAHWSWLAGPVLENATRIYLVTQSGIPELRNANRVITSCLGEYSTRLEVVMNRHDSRSSNLDENTVNRALTRKIEWRIPSDYVNVRKHQNEASPLVLTESAVSDAINRMARKASGLPEETEKKKRFSLFR